MGWLQNIFNSRRDDNKEKSLVLQKSSLKHKLHFLIPEPTRSLLFITDESPEKVQSPLTIKITINITTDGINSNTTRDEGNLFAEPSLIWAKLHIEPNEELETKPMYFPSYYGLSPKQRYQYVNWLQDVTMPTNLSYVFLYYYGLERHLLIGDYDKAVDEILRLIKFHDHDKFRFYVIRPLIASSLFKNRTDLFDRAPFLMKEVTNEALVMRFYYNSPLNADDLINLSSRVGFSNKRYIKQCPDLFRKVLQEKIDEEESKNGPILQRFDLDNLKWEKESLFTNTSIPEKFSSAKVPQLLENPLFQKTINDLLASTHSGVRVIKGLSAEPLQRKKSKKKYRSKN